MVDFRSFLPQPPWYGPPIPRILANRSDSYVNGGEDGALVPVATRIGEPIRIIREVPRPEPMKIPQAPPTPAPTPEYVPVKQGRYGGLIGW